MDKIAVISDIHGNLEALNAALDDIKKRNINKIICLGDIVAKGTHQNECVDIIKEKCDVVIKGNCEHYPLDDEYIKIASEIDRKRALWIRSKLTDENKIYLNNLPFSYEMYISGRLVRFIHGHPEEVSKFISNIDLPNNLYSLFLPSKNTVSSLKADVLVYGHIHTQFMQRIYNRTILNPGSIGNALDIFRNKEKDGNVKNTTLVNYLIINGNIDSKNMDDSISYEFISIPYDIEKELSSNKDNIEYESYSEELLSGQYRNMNRIYDSFKARGFNPDDI